MSAINRRQARRRGAARRWMMGALLALLTLVLGCDRDEQMVSAPTRATPAQGAATHGAAPGRGAAAPAPGPEASARAPAAAPDDAAALRPPVALRHPAPARLVAIGDVHGDLAATRRALALAGAIDDAGRWRGGDLVVVQTGDVLDRGDDEQAILDLFLRLEEEAAAAGGAFIMLHGNHEIMNVQGDLRYVTPGGLADFEDVEGLQINHPALQRAPTAARARLAAFSPGGLYAQRLAHHNVAVIVGDTVFAHGGVLPEHVAYGLERLNQETRAWMLGAGPAPAALQGPQSPIWTRLYSAEDGDAAGCEALSAALEAAGAARMVVGHTPQLGGITSACDGRVWRIDTGMASHYGGPVEALEIQGGQARALRAP